jgi:hypothetical protein
MHSEQEAVTAVRNGSPSTAQAATFSPSGPAGSSERRNAWWNNLQFGGPLRARRAGEPEALILTLICALDMYTTIWWVLTGRAVEANPHLAWTFHLHPVAFVFVKCATCLPALLLAPVLAQKHPKFVTWLLRAIIVIYVGAYLTFVE